MALSAFCARSGRASSAPASRVRSPGAAESAGVDPPAPGRSQPGRASSTPAMTSAAIRARLVQQSALPARDCGGRRGLAHNVGGRAAGERRVHFPERRESIVRFLLEAPHDDLAQPRRRVGTQLFKGQRLRQMQLSEHVRSRLAVERPVSGQHLVADHPERKNVGASVHIVADGLLRRHVPHRSERRPLTRQLEFGVASTVSAAASAWVCRALASPKSRTFTSPSRVTMMLPGFRSRWTMLARCARPTAAAICVAYFRSRRSACPGAAGSRGSARRRTPSR